MKITTLWALAATLALLPAAASEIVPAAPIGFEPVNLRMTVDGCAFVPGSVRVSAEANVIRVTQSLNACFVPGPPQVVDVRLGSLAVGKYVAEVYWSPMVTDTPAERLAFEVVSRVEAAVFPPPPRPLTDYTGVWFNPAESGWGLSLHQSATDGMFGALFVYGADHEAEWFTLQGGRWESSTLWAATVYRTRGPHYALASFDPAQVSLEAVGTSTFDVRQRTGSEDYFLLSYTIDGHQSLKVVRRMGF